MKNIKLMSLLFALLQSAFMFSSGCTGFEDLPHSKEDVWVLEYKPVDFSGYIRDAEARVDGIYPYNDPVPSKVGFYNGDMAQYKKDLLEKYPKKSCLQTQDTGSVVNKTLQRKTRDASAYQRSEHILQDAVTQQKISDYLGDVVILKGELDTAAQSKEWYRTIAYFGFNRFWNSIHTPHVSSERLAQEVSTVRAQKYVLLKNDRNYSFQNARNKFVEDFRAMDPKPQYSFSTITESKLDAAYKNLSNKVELQYQTEELTKEKYFYQRVIVATWLAALSAASVGGYLWTTKK